MTTRNVQPYSKNLFVFFNALLFALLGYPYLVKILSSPSLFYNADTLFNKPFTQAVIVLINTSLYLCYMALAALLLLLIPRRLRWLLLLLSSAIALTLLSDVYVFKLFHFHLNRQVLGLFFHQELPQVLSLAPSELGIITLLVGVILGVEYYLLRLSSRLAVSKFWLRLIRVFAITWILLFFSVLQILISTTSRQNNLFSQHLSQLPFALQAFKAIAPKKTLAFVNRHNGNFYEASAGKQFNYPKHPLQCSPPPKPYNIILIGIDTLRFDSVTPKTMPHLSQFIQNSIQFNNHYSGGNSTQTGLFSLFYSIPSHYWNSALTHQRPPVLIDWLKQQGYQRKVIWSTNMRHPKVTQTLYKGISNLRLDAAPGSDAMTWDQYTSRQAIHFLNEKSKSKQPFFLHLFYHSLHAFCRTNQYQTLFKPSISACHRLTLNNQTDPKPYRNRYLNVAHALDEILKPLLNTLKDQGLLKNTIVMITSDHGQEFNDTHQNYWGHTSNYSRYQLQVPFYLYWPNQPKQIISYPTAHYDLVPTLMQQAFHCDNPSSDYSIGNNLFNPRKERFIIAGSYTDMAMISQDTITVFKPSGDISLMNQRMQQLNQAAKPQTIRKFIELNHRFG